MVVAGALVVVAVVFVVVVVIGLVDNCAVVSVFSFDLDVVFAMTVVFTVVLFFGVCFVASMIKK